MQHNGAASEELVSGWLEIARAAGMADVPLKKIRAIAARDSWPVYRAGHNYVACPADLIAHIRALAKSRSADKDPVQALMAGSA